MILEVSWDDLWTLSFGLSQFHGHGSWLMCEVALKCHTLNSTCQLMWGFFLHKSHHTSHQNYNLCMSIDVHFLCAKSCVSNVKNFVSNTHCRDYVVVRALDSHPKFASLTWFKLLVFASCLPLGGTPDVKFGRP
jgi:hypothetical protein